MNKAPIIRYLPLITFLLITPCGSDSLCFPLLLVLPIALAAGDLTSVLPLVGVGLILVSGPVQSTKSKIGYVLGILILVLTLIKIPYDAGNSFEYVWNSFITYFLTGVFILSSIISVWLITLFKTKNKVVYLY